MVWYAAWQLACVHVEQGRPVTATAYLYWLMDYEAEHGYRYITPPRSRRELTICSGDSETERGAAYTLANADREKKTI